MATTPMIGQKGSTALHTFGANELARIPMKIGARTTCFANATGKSVAALPWQSGAAEHPVSSETYGKHRCSHISPNHAETQRQNMGEWVSSYLDGGHDNSHGVNRDERSQDELGNERRHEDGADGRGCRHEDAESHIALQTETVRGVPVSHKVRKQPQRPSFAS